MADDVIFQEAMDALRDGNKARARELLTGLIKEDQNNVEYWIWLSAAMETAKERMYCLQTAFKLDPENAAAKRGLILLGAISADETIQPFSMNRPRVWEEKLLLAHEKPKLKGWAAVKASPVFRLGLVILLIGGHCRRYRIRVSSSLPEPQHRQTDLYPGTGADLSQSPSPPSARRPADTGRVARRGATPDLEVPYTPTASLRANRTLAAHVRLPASIRSRLQTGRLGRSHRRARKSHSR